MKPKYFKILAVVLVLTVVAAIAVAQGMRRGHTRRDGMFGGPMMGYYIHKLNLTDAQQAQVKAIMAKDKPAIQPLMLQMAQGHVQLREQVMSGNFDEAKVRDLASQKSQAMTELIVQYARTGSEMVKVLTPEQKTKLAALMKEHEQRFMNRMQGKSQEAKPSQ